MKTYVAKVGCLWLTDSFHRNCGVVSKSWITYDDVKWFYLERLPGKERSTISLGEIRNAEVSMKKKHQYQLQGYFFSSAVLFA